MMCIKSTIGNLMRKNIKQKKLCPVLGIPDKAFYGSLSVHGYQKLSVVHGTFHLIQEEFHGFKRVHIIHIFS